MADEREYEIAFTDKHGDTLRVYDYSTFSELMVACDQRCVILNLEEAKTLRRWLDNWIRSKQDALFPD